MFAKKFDNYKNNTNTYYDLVTTAYRLFFGEHFHLFIWENGQTRDEALMQTNRMFFRDGKLSKSSKIIDLGCGIGSLSLQIAKEYNCQATGVNINKHQLDIARSKAKEQNLDVRFVEQDIMELNLGEKFDTAFFIDADPHLPDKKKAIQNIKKHLKEKGRIVITAWLTNDKPTFAEKEFLIKPFCKLTAFPYMASFPEYKEIFKQEKLKVIKFQDITDGVRKSVDDLYETAFKTMRELSSLQKMISFAKAAGGSFLAQAIKRHDGGNLMKTANEMFLDLIYTKVCTDAGVFKVGYFVVEN